jgi:hypothetical protein
MKISGYNLMKKGGKWLGAARSWIQWNIPRGDSVTWGSDETVTVSIRQLEELAADVAAAVINEQNGY